jgi:hypothetical protein
MVYQVSDDTRICNYTFIREEDLGVDEETGQPRKLRRCSKCKEVFYKDQPSQRAHWKVHKQVCCLLANDPDFAKLQQPLPMENIVNNIGVFFQHPFQQIKGRYFLYLLQEFKRACIEDPRVYDNSRGVLGILEETTLGQIEYAFRTHGAAKFAQLVFAIPGFASFFFSDDLLLSRVAAEKKRSGEELSEEELADGSLELSLAFSDVVQALFRGFILHNGDIRDKPLSAALLRRTMMFWQCPYTRASFSPIRPLDEANHQPVGSTFDRSYFFFTLFYSAYQYSSPTADRARRKDEIVAGLTAKQFLTVLTEDVDFYHALPSNPVRALFHVIDWEHHLNQNEGPWKYLAASDRVELLNKAQRLEEKLEHNLERPRLRHHAQLEFGTPLDVKNELTWLIISNQSNILLKMHKAIDWNSGNGGYAAFRVGMVYNRHKRIAGWRTKWYLEAIEPLYQREMERQGMPALSCPEDIVDHINEYSFPTRAWETKEFDYEW